MLKKTQRSLLQPALEHILCKDLFGKVNYFSEISQIWRRYEYNVYQMNFVCNSLIVNPVMPICTFIFNP